MVEIGSKCGMASNKGLNLFHNGHCEYNNIVWETRAAASKLVNNHGLQVVRPEPVLGRNYYYNNTIWRDNMGRWRINNCLNRLVLLSNVFGRVILPGTGPHSSAWQSLLHGLIFMGKQCRRAYLPQGKSHESKESSHAPA